MRCHRLVWRPQSLWCLHSLWRPFPMWRPHSLWWSSLIAARSALTAVCDGQSKGVVSEVLRSILWLLACLRHLELRVLPARARLTHRHLNRPSGSGLWVSGFRPGYPLYNGGRTGVLCCGLLPNSRHFRGYSQCLRCWGPERDPPKLRAIVDVHRTSEERGKL